MGECGNEESLGIFIVQKPVLYFWHNMAADTTFIFTFNDWNLKNDLHGIMWNIICPVVKVFYYFYHIFCG